MANLVLFYGSFLLLTYPANVELFRLDLATLLNLLLISQHQQLLGHTHLINALHQHGLPMGSNATVIALWFWLLLGVVLIVSTVLAVAAVVGVVVVLVVEAGSGCVLLSQEIVQFDVERCHWR